MTEYQPPEVLRRTIGPVQMAFYATGSMLGAGIYALVGKAAGTSGNAIWLSFIVALIAASLTCLTYASLGSRYPRAGGTAFIVERAFNSPMLGFVVGLCLACSAVIGIPTLAQVFARSFIDAFGLSEPMVPFITVGFLMIMAGIIYRGIRESMWANILCTCIEATGLLIIIVTGFSYWGNVDYFEVPVQTSGLFAGPDMLFAAVMASTVFTFFAFIGFEDTLNVAEECENPQRTLPIGLLTAMAIVAVLYICVAITVVSVVPWQSLKDAASPLTEVVRITAPAVPPTLFTLIALFAIANTALVNYVTASRLLYGMSEQKLIPTFLSKVHSKRRTPHAAIGLLFILFMPSAIFGTIEQLATVSVLILLSVFALMNISLIILKSREGEKAGKFEIPLIVPILGAVVCVAMIVARVSMGEWTAPAFAGGILVFVLALYVLAQTKRGRA